MQAFLVSLATVAVAEMGDRTQLLSMLLAARFRKPLPIVAGIFAATLASNVIAALVGVEFARYLTPKVLNLLVGVSMLVMAAWTLVPDRADDDGPPKGRGAFGAAFVAFFLAEIGDKTQIATMALAAGYRTPWAVVAGSTLGMMIANAPSVLLGHNFATRLPMKAIRAGAALLFAVLGIWFIWQGTH